LSEVVPICSNFIKVVKIHPNDFDFIQIWIKLIIHSDISERTKILRELSYVAHLWTRLFEVAYNWMKVLQIGKIWFDWWTSPKCFQLIWMFLFSPRFDWGYWSLPKCSYFTQMFLILPKTLLKFFSWPKFDEGCWNYHMIPVHSRAVFFCHQEQKRIAVLAIILLLIWLLVCLSLENRYYLITCECSCILCPNFEIFCSNNGQFFSVGDATASPASPCHMLMVACVWVVMW